MKLAIEIGARAVEGEAFGNLGNAYFLLGDIGKAIECKDKHLKMAIQIGDRPGEGRTYGNLGVAYGAMGDIQKAIEYIEKCLKIAIEIGDRDGERMAYNNIGVGYSELGQFDIAVGNFVLVVDVYNTLRSLLKSEVNWKMKYRDLREKTYTSLWVIAKNWKDQRGLGCC